MSVTPSTGMLRSAVTGKSVSRAMTSPGVALLNAASKPASLCTITFPGVGQAVVAPAEKDGLEGALDVAGS